MPEIELKLEVPAERRAAVDAAVAGRAPRPPLRLQAAYHDTADARLAAAGLALRLRREGRRWVQTLKAAGDDGLTRFEHEVGRGGAAAMPAIEPMLHAATPAGTRLLALLDGAPPLALESVYRTDIRRRVRVLGVRRAGQAAARVELAFDRGRIEAGAGRAIEVSELEIELVAGTPLAVIEIARRWQARFGLWVDVRSKAERGERLARGEAAARAQAAPALDATFDAALAWQAVLRGVAAPVLAHASRVASGAYDAEQVHQLRVGLRRLRSVIALFDGLAVVSAAGALDAGAAQLFRALGAARDRTVIDAAFGAPLAAAMRAAGLAVSDAPGPPPAPADEVAPELAVRSAAGQALLFDLLAAMHPGPAAAPVPDAAALRAHLIRRLNRWHKRVAADALRYAALDDAARHRLRKRAKRLRYAAECCAGAFAPGRVRRYLKALRALQDRLGAVSDAAMALRDCAPRAPHDAAAMFALGWLSARRDALVAAAAPDLEAFAATRRFWKG